MKASLLLKLLSLPLLAGLLLAACTMPAPGSQCAKYGEVSVCEPVQSFYLHYGGPAKFGYPLADRVEQGDNLVQHFEKVALSYPADSPRFESVRLIPLGLADLEHATSPEPRRVDPDCRYYERYGHFVCLAFLDYFVQLGGERVAGQPISEVLTEDNVRVQYFENVKFKWVLEGGQPHVELEALGQTACLQDLASCRGEGQTDLARLGTELIPTPDNQVAQALDDYVAGHGGEFVFGARLGDLIFAGEVAYQYYENSCLLWDNATQRVLPVPLGRLAAPQVDRADPPEPSETVQYFEQTGHSVIMAFLDFYRAHGGEAVFGLPLTEFQDEWGLWLQWFENVCFEWHPDYPNGERVRLRPLGEISFRQYGGRLPPPLQQRLVATPTEDPLPAEVILRVVPKNPIHTRGDTQIVNLLAEDAAGRPLPGLIITLYISTSAVEQFTQTEPTDSNGSVWVELDAVPGTCGELIQLRAVTPTRGGSAAAESHFTLWCEPSP